MPSAGQLRRAEVADDGGVGEQEQRLGDQGEERRDGEPEDLRGRAPAVALRRGHRPAYPAGRTSAPCS